MTSISVCELQKLGKTSLTQQQLKTLLGAEIEAYRRAQNMNKPLREGRRCWVLDYADGAQFHMDIVPALPNGQAARVLLESRGHDARWTITAIAITDKEGPTYYAVTDDWPRSNPKGYCEWFKSRMAAALERRKRVLAESMRASVEDIPDYKVRTPLQAAIMILKRHRDHTFEHRGDERPISVIITTLASHAYNGEETIGEAFAVILAGMDQHILWHNNRYWIPNPTDPLENFADKWAEHPERATAFYEWLQNGQDGICRGSAIERQESDHRNGRTRRRRIAGRSRGTPPPAASPVSTAENRFGGAARRGSFLSGQKPGPDQASGVRRRGMIWWLENPTRARSERQGVAELAERVSWLKGVRWICRTALGSPSTSRSNTTVTAFR